MSTMDFLYLESSAEMSILYMQFCTFLICNFGHFNYALNSKGTDSSSMRACPPGSDESFLIIPDHSEPPVRTLRATIPESESHSPAVYSTVLLTWASIAHDYPAMQHISAFIPIAEATSLSCATHIKSLSRHKTAGSDRPEPWLRLLRTGGSTTP